MRAQYEMIPFEQLLVWLPFALMLWCCWRPKTYLLWLDISLITALGMLNSPSARLKACFYPYTLYLTLAVILVRLVCVSKCAPLVSGKPRVKRWVLIPLLLAALCLNARNMWKLHPSDSGVWSCIGAAYMMENGYLPYGQFYDGDTYGPGLYLFHIPIEALIPVSSTYNWQEAKKPGGAVIGGGRGNGVGHRVTALLFHLFMVTGIVTVGKRVAKNLDWGLAWACIYAMSPAVWTKLNESSQVIPSALYVWAIALVHYPIVAGILNSMATATMFYPGFLIPLWTGWYRKCNQQWLRFVAAVTIVGIISLSAALVFTKPQPDQSRVGTFLKKSTQEGGDFNASDGFWPRMPELARKWVQRPLIVCYLVFCVALFWLPKQQPARFLPAMAAAVCLSANLWKSHLNTGSYSIWYAAPMIMAFLWPSQTTET